MLMNSRIQGRKNDTNELRFFEAILRLEDLDQCRSFFQVLLTDSELERIFARWPITQMLGEAILTNKDIAEAVGVSTTTVSMVNARLKRSGAPLKPFLQKLRSQRTPREP